MACALATEFEADAFMPLVFGMPTTPVFTGMPLGVTGSNKAGALIFMWFCESRVQNGGRASPLTHAGMACAIYIGRKMTIYSEIDSMDTFEFTKAYSTSMSAAVSRRRWLMAVPAWAALPTLSAQIRYPDRPVKCIIPNSPGSSVDTIGRAVIAEMSRWMGHPVVLDNRAGAAGILAE